MYDECVPFHVRIDNKIWRPSDVGKFLLFLSFLLWGPESVCVSESVVLVLPQPNPLDADICHRSVLRSATFALCRTY